MNIALIGATGFIGSGVLSEALSRGHKVTAIARHPETIVQAPNLVVAAGDATNADFLTPLLAGNDVVIGSYNRGKDEDGSATQGIVEAVKQSGVARFLVVGGAGSLEVSPGKRLVDDPHFPEEWKAGALRTSAFLDFLRKEKDWTGFI